MRRPTAEVLAHAAKSVRREIGMRARVYPAWVQKGRMSKVDADFEIEGMRQAGFALDYLADMVKAELPAEARGLAAALRERCQCVDDNPLIRGAMTTGGRIDNCMNCKAADVIERLASKEESNAQ